MKVKIIFSTIGIIILIGVLSTVFGWFGEAATVAKEEFGPRAALSKYEWFKDASAVLQAKEIDIEVFTVNMTNLRADYEGTKRKDWDRTDKEQFNQWSLEIAGLKSSFNDLAAEYNAASSKFNWASFEGEPTQIKRNFINY